jgi:hypothetical protein
MQITFTPVVGKQTSSGFPVTHSTPLPAGVKGAYVAQGVLYLYGETKTAAKGDITADLAAIIAAEVAKALAAAKK